MSAASPLPPGERDRVRGSRDSRTCRHARPPHPALSPGGRGFLALALALLLLIALPAHAAPLDIAPAGAPQPVFTWKTEACEPWDVPDAPARAWRGADGAVHLLASHHRARLMSGPTLDSLRHECRVVFEAAHDPAPEHVNDRGWLVSPYTLDGRTIHALVHNEFHGHTRPALCPSKRYASCWWNSITATVSTDGGRSFGPPRFVAGLPYPYQGDLGHRAGLFSPSSIVARDGWYYAMLFAEGFGAQKRGVCVMRTRDLADPASWRAWDGAGFTVAFTQDTDTPERHVCAPLPRLFGTVTSLVRHRPSGLYVALMQGGKPGGVWAATSPDLTTWSEPRLVWQAPAAFAPDCGQRYAYDYPSLLDPSSPSRNFEDIGETAFLYLTRLALNGCKPGTERDLVRLPVTIRQAPSSH